jgi:hypothetical protein
MVSDAAKAKADAKAAKKAAKLEGKMAKSGVSAATKLLQLGFHLAVGSWRTSQEAWCLHSCFICISI